MAARIVCTNCGSKFPISGPQAKPKIRCPQCGYYTAVPEEHRAGEEPEFQAQTPFDEPPKEKPRRPEPPAPAPEPRKPPAKAKAKRRMDPRDTRPDFASDEPSGPPLLQGTQEEHDDMALPYTVPGSGTKPCPECDGELPLDATFCVHCGLDLETGKLAKPKQVKPMLREWEEGIPFKLRVRIFLALLFIDAVLTILAMIASQQSLSDIGSIVANLLGNAFMVGMQAFIVGTQEILTVKRNSRGAAVLERTRRIAFFKLKQWRIEWKKSIGTGVVAAHDPGIFTILIMVSLCMMGLLPGIVFYFLVVRPNRYYICLCDVYGGVEEYLFQTFDSDWAHEIAQEVATATGLKYRRAL